MRVPISEAKMLAYGPQKVTARLTHPDGTLF
jgi:hypothetical protein